VPKRTIQGINADVEILVDRVRKTLKKKPRRESVKRFKAEVEILKRIGEDDPPIDRVVPILKYDLSKKPYWYEMPRLDGDLEAVVHEYRGDVIGAVTSFLPVVRALEQLSKRDPPVFHRDIKPRNILYKGDGKRRELWLADFGCAHLADPQAHRHTLDFRAVGAVEYRAPEYAHGRVENVTESGDVFSIGKLLWHMVNGVPHEVFPYTLWYPARYDLALRFAGDPLASRLNLIIANCVQHDPSKRPSYNALIEQLENLLIASGEPEEVSLRDKLARREAYIQMAAEEARAHAGVLRNIALNDLRDAQSQLRPELQGLDPWKAFLGTPTETTDSRLRQVTDGAGTDIIWSANVRGLKAYAILYSHTVSTPPGGSQYPFVEMSIRPKNGQPLTVRIWEGAEGQILQQTNFGSDARQQRTYEGNAALPLFRAALEALADEELPV
jgi:serine/threonine protein kinase